MNVSRFGKNGICCAGLTLGVLDPLSQAFSETGRQFEGALIGDEVDDVPGAVDQGFAVMTFFEMCLELG